MKRRDLFKFAALLPLAPLVGFTPETEEYIDELESSVDKKWTTNSNGSIIIPVLPLISILRKKGVACQPTILPNFIDNLGQAHSTRFIKLKCAMIVNGFGDLNTFEIYPKVAEEMIEMKQRFPGKILYISDFITSPVIKDPSWTFRRGLMLRFFWAS